MRDEYAVRYAIVVKHLFDVGMFFIELKSILRCNNPKYRPIDLFSFVVGHVVASIAQDNPQRASLQDRAIDEIKEHDVPDEVAEEFIKRLEYCLDLIFSKAYGDTYKERLRRCNVTVNHHLDLVLEEYPSS